MLGNYNQYNNNKNFPDKGGLISIVRQTNTDSKLNNILTKVALL